MKVKNEFVDKALAQLESISDGNSYGYSLRTDNTDSHIFPRRHKFFLYIRVVDGFCAPGTYGREIASFNNFTEFLNYVQDCVEFHNDSLVMTDEELFNKYY